MWEFLLRLLPEFIDKHTPNIPYITRAYHGYDRFVRFWFSWPCRLMRFILALLVVSNQAGMLPEGELSTLLFGHVPQFCRERLDQISAYATRYIYDTDGLGLLWYARYLYDGASKQLVRYHEDVLHCVIRIIHSCLLCSFAASLYAFLHSAYVFVLETVFLLIISIYAYTLTKDGGNRFFIDAPFKKYFDEEGVLITDITATPVNTIDSYVSICRAKKKASDRQLASDAVRIDKDCLVNYPVKDINEMIRITKRRARRRSMEVFCHAINPFNQMSLLVNRNQKRPLRFLAFIFTTPIMVLLIAVVWLFAVLIGAFLFSIPFTLSAFWIYLGYVFATTMNARKIGICTGLIALHIWILPIAKTFFGFTKGWLTLTLINAPKAIKTWHKNILEPKDTKSQDGLAFGMSYYSNMIKAAYKQYYSFREEDGFNVSERLSELAALKLVRKPNVHLLLSKKGYLYLVKTDKANREVSHISFELRGMQYKYDTEKLSNIPEQSIDDIGNRFYKIDLLNHLIITE